MHFAQSTYCVRILIHKDMEDGGRRLHLSAVSSANEESIFKGNGGTRCIGNRPLRFERAMQQHTDRGMNMMSLLVATFIFVIPLGGCVCTIGCHFLVDLNLELLLPLSML